MFKSTWGKMDKLKEEDSAKKFQNRTERHENTSVRHAIASLGQLPFCFGTLLALLMVYVGCQQALTCSTDF